MYKTLGFKWLPGAFCPAPTFATADRVEARNPHLRVASYVIAQCKKPTRKMAHLVFPDTRPS